jgi:hypothetical protein
MQKFKIYLSRDTLRIFALINVSLLWTELPVVDIEFFYTKTHDSV